jgi:hypothetical protein
MSLIGNQVVIDDLCEPRMVGRGAQNVVLDVHAMRPKTWRPPTHEESRSSGSEILGLARASRRRHHAGDRCASALADGSSSVSAETPPAISDERH